jgi:hypothetical protein
LPAPPRAERQGFLPRPGGDFDVDVFHFDSFNDSSKIGISKQNYSLKIKTEPLCR